MSSSIPPFTLGSGASNYRRLDIETDPWRDRNRYRTRRDDAIAAYRLHSHDPRLWRVQVTTGTDTGASRTRDVQLVRCEQCGAVTHLSARPLRRSRDLELDICVPVPPDEMAAVVLRTNRNEKLLFNALVGVGFAALAAAMLMATLDAPPDNRAIGFLGVALWTAVSVFGWVSFRNVFRDERKREEWNQHLRERTSDPADNFISRTKDEHA